MIFSKLARGISRSSASRFESGVVRGLRQRFINGASVKPPPLSVRDGLLGFLRSYSTPIVAGKGGLKSLLANPGFRRFFSSGSPNKKNYQNYYPKEQKEIPKGHGNNKKSDSKVLGDATRAPKDPVPSLGYPVHCMGLRK